MNREAFEICLGFDGRGLYALFYESPKEYPTSPTKSIEFPLERFIERELIAKLAEAVARGRYIQLGSISQENIQDLQNKRPLKYWERKLFVETYNKTMISRIKTNVPSS